MKKAIVAVVYGLGGSWLDPKGGELYLVQRLQSIGVETTNSPFNYFDTKGVLSLLHQPADFRAIVGDSLGACNAPFFAAQYGQKIDYIAGFQPSIYGQNFPIPPNVAVAHCIYDPYFIDTAGLGAAKWELAARNRTTKLLITEHRGAHPDDYGYSQNLVFAEIKHLIEN